AVQRIGQQAQLARSLVVANGLGHACFRRIKWDAAMQGTQARGQAFMMGALSPVQMTAVQA
ncbi:MAG TPA: hypothetical protein PL007_09275, partial [Thermomonas sp.]|nr:hypothetical protein [Thermomonas sp.]